jgi:hypothetical protein
VNTPPRSFPCPYACGRWTARPAYACCLDCRWSHTVAGRVPAHSLYCDRRTQTEPSPAGRGTAPRRMDRALESPPPPPPAMSERLDALEMRVGLLEETVAGYLQYLMRTCGKEAPHA